VRYAPVLHLQKGLKPTVVVEAVLEGLRAATRETGILAGVLVCGIRNMSPDTPCGWAELSVAYKNRGVLGFDLGRRGARKPGKDHQEAFQLILNNNINCTCTRERRTASLHLEQVAVLAQPHAVPDAVARRSSAAPAR